MNDDTLLPVDLPAVARKNVTVAFDGGRLSSDGDVLLLKSVESAEGGSWDDYHAKISTRDVPDFRAVLM